MEEQNLEKNFDLRQQGGIPEGNPLFVAVIENDLNTLKSLIESGHSVNSKDREGATLLVHIMKHERVEMFDYMLSLEELQIDQTDNKGISALLYAVMFKGSNKYFALKLIDKGANINLRDHAGRTILHILAAWNRSDNLKLGKLVIEKGVDVNVQDRYGRTPLYKACERGNYDWIYMLLYYGALATIPSNNGTLPFAVLSPPYFMRTRERDYAHLVETLQSYL